MAMNIISKEKKEIRYSFIDISNRNVIKVIVATKENYKLDTFPLADKFLILLPFSADGWVFQQIPFRKQTVWSWIRQRGSKESKPKRNSFKISFYRLVLKLYFSILTYIVITQ